MKNHHACNNSIGSGDRWDYVASHWFDVKSAFLRNSKNVSANIGACCHKIHSVLIVLIPNQMIVWRFFLRGFQCLAQTFHRFAEDWAAFGNTPALLVLQSRLVDFFTASSYSIWQFPPIQWRRRSSFFPQIIHAQQILDVIVKKLREQFFWIIVARLSPNSCGNPVDIPFIIGFRL